MKGSKYNRVFFYFDTYTIVSDSNAVEIFKPFEFFKIRNFRNGLIGLIFKMMSRIPFLSFWSFSASNCFAN